MAEAIRRTALKEKATAAIQTLSRGYRQRVGVAQALLHGPDIIILDEPTNGLDPTQIRHMRELIRELAKTATVIVSTHILQEVQAVCERVLIMRAGRLVIDSRIDALQQGRGLQVEIEGDPRPALAALPAVTAVHPGRTVAGPDALPAGRAARRRPGRGRCPEPCRHPPACADATAARSGNRVCRGQWSAPRDRRRSGP